MEFGDIGLAYTINDYYGLPQSGERAWPGRQAASLVPFEQRALAVEKALLDDIEESALRKLRHPVRSRRIAHHLENC